MLSIPGLRPRCRSDLCCQMGRMQHWATLAVHLQNVTACCCCEWESWQVLLWESLICSFVVHTAQQHLHIDERWHLQGGHVHVLLRAPRLPPTPMPLIRDESASWLSSHQLKRLLLDSRHHNTYKKRVLRGV